MAETMIQHAERDPTLASKYLPRIVSHTDRLARLATQLLDLAQLESGDLVGTFEPGRLDEVVEEVLHTCTSPAADKGIRLSAEAPESVPTVQGDRDRLLQVVLNLVDNAIRYTGSEGEVTVSIGVRGDNVELRVRDTGAGIAPEHLPHLFERFYRVDQARTRDRGGTGLGLSIVQQIVEAHGGTIDVASVVGEGTCFTICLPLVKEGAAKRPQTQEVGAV
jgi:signal transduction histidine kinase